MSQVNDAVALIRKRGVMRSYEIEEALGCKSIAATLAPRVADGTLVVCKVERPGLRACNEYRMSVAGGGRLTARNGDLCLKRLPAATPRADETLASSVQPAPLAGSPRIGPIEKGVPMPGSKRGNGELKEQIAKLQVGDSFVTDYSDSACYGMARRLGMKVISRPADGTGKLTRLAGQRIRVWRTE